MWTRRAWFAYAAGQAVSAAPRVETGRVTELEWAHLPAAAQRLSESMGLTAASWAGWREERAKALGTRVAEGSAEHVIYYLLQSRAFTQAEPLVPVKLAREAPNAMTAAAAARARAFRLSLETPLGARHSLVARLARSIEPEWPVERAYRHTMSFLRSKEVDRSEPLEEIYFKRGLSSDTSMAGVAVLDALPRAAGPRRILLAGPGLDLTRREKFDDSLPLKSYQLQHLRRRYPAAVVDLVDVRPEVIETLGARRGDVTVSYLDGGYDLVIATNLLVYFDGRELLSALAGFARSLAPGGQLLHNDTRFAAKVFGEALGLPVEKFEPRQLAVRNGIEQWDRAVIHRKAR